MIMSTEISLLQISPTRNHSGLVCLVASCFLSSSVIYSHTDAVFPRNYLDRIEFYRRRIFSCAATGKSRLTFEEALVSEHNAQLKSGKFPDVFLEPLAKFVHHSAYHSKRVCYVFDFGYLSVQIFLGRRSINGRFLCSGAFFLTYCLDTLPLKELLDAFVESLELVVFPGEKCEVRGQEAVLTSFLASGTAKGDWQATLTLLRPSDRDISPQTLPKSGFVYVLPFASNTHTIAH